MKNIKLFLSENYQVLEVKLSIYLNRRVFVMGTFRLTCIESSLSAWRNFAFLAIQNAFSEDSDQTVRMCSLI